MTSVKVCCIRSREEAKLAIDHGASALGLVSAMPSGPGVIDEATIAHIATGVPPAVSTFLLTSLTEPEAIVAQAERTGPDTLQLVDRVSAETLRRLRERLPGTALVQVIHVTGPAAIDEAVAVAPLADALLLDSGDPTRPMKELGGTGRTHDWEVSREIVEAVERPVYLAGGLRPDNVAEAIDRVRPFGVDLCSGIRIDGRLDERLLVAFMHEVRSAA